MKFFWKYFFPPLYGLVVYFTIRLLLDSATGMKFWERSWKLNLFEQSFCVLMGYLFVWTFRRLFRYFDSHWLGSIGYKRIARELFYVFLVNLIFQNAFLTPMAALTDDGLQWYDFIDINTIPLLYALIFYGVSRSGMFLQAFINNKILLEKITNDKLLTELKFLKAQYHPHFLFNALNTIYFQMDEDVSKAKKSIEKFSELLRYQLYDQQQTVPISREIQYLEHFIALQQARSSEKLQLLVNFNENLNGQQVYPLLFLPLVENAFKYVGGDFHMLIEAWEEKNSIRFRVINSIPEAIVTEKKEGGIGLDNLKRRLELLYPGKHRFTIQKEKEQFSAELNITLTRYGQTT
jgi:hypothetical protein